MKDEDILNMIQNLQEQITLVNEKVNTMLKVFEKWILALDVAMSGNQDLKTNLKNVLNANLIGGVKNGKSKRIYENSKDL